MKLRVILILLALGCLAACSRNADPTATPLPLPHSMKGYELYSWQADVEWHFTLVTGTNRLKSLEEITSGADTVSADGWVRISVQGVDALKSLLRRLPEHEEILWIGKQWRERALVDAGNLGVPAGVITNVIEEHCRQLGLELRVSS